MYLSHSRRPHPAVAALVVSMLAAAASNAASASSSVSRQAIIDQYCAGCHNEKSKSGGIVLHGLRIASDLFHVVPLFGFVGGLLTFIHFVLFACLATLGAGALVRGEYQRRSLQTWWSRMRPAGAPRNDMPPPPPPPPPPATPPPPPGPSSAEVIG